jgi:DNA ligase-1
MVKLLPTLYKRASTGKMLSWRIETDGAIITEVWGQIGGSLQMTSDTIRKGKNIGKANETTPETQAQAEAKSKWEKKQKAGNYNESLEAAEAGEASDMVEGGLLPMLAHKYKDHAAKITYPCFLQPKLDGHRSIAAPEPDGALLKTPTVKLWSRTRQPKRAWPHIVNRLNDLWRGAGVAAYPLDGEAYNHDYRDKFEELSHFLQQEEYIPGSEVVEYHIYDCIIDGMGFAERHAKLAELLSREPKNSPLKLVETIEVKDEDEMMLAFERFLELGYEGVVVRNSAGLYEHKRSYNLQKVKQFDDDEFVIQAVIEGRGKLAGHAVFSCVTKEGVPFEAKLKGDQKKLKVYWEHPEQVIGKTLTVKYQGWFKSGKPRFAVGWRLREDL